MNVLKQYRAQNKRSLQLFTRAQRSLPSGNTRSALYWPPHPLYLVSGAGGRVTDADGNTRIDLNYNNTALIHGHNHPEIVKAAQEQFSHGTVLGAPTEPEVKLAEELVKRLGGGHRIRFTPSGTEANMQATRTARSATGRHMIAKCLGAYHGSWDAVPLTPDAPDIPQGVKDNTLYFPYNDPDAAEKLIKKHRDTLAAVILEPTMRDMTPEPGFLKAVREATEANDVLLIFDEVISFRLSPGGAQRLYGVIPDMTTMGKIIGGGFPVGAYAAPEEHMAPLMIPEVELPETASPALGFSGTFNAHPVTMAAGLAAMKMLTQAKYKNLASMGERMRTGLRNVLDEAGLKAYVGGAGSLFFISWTDQTVRDHASSQTANRALSHLFNLGMMNKGVFILGHPNVSTVLTGEDAKTVLEAARATVEELKPFIRDRAPHLVA
ncbi:MAG: aspartate aminotransferase family protein [Candidatus Bathyarchaeota archaeon]